MKGSLIVLEGGEGSGKSSIIERMKSEVKSDNVVFTREPGGSPRAEEIRRYLFSEEGKTLSADSQFHLFWAARMDHIKETIQPALENGKIVISDRFDMSTYAYQIFGEEHHDLKFLFGLIRGRMLTMIPAPTYLWFKVDPVVGLQRKRGVADVNHFDEKDIEFHKRVHRGYGDFTAVGRVIELDASLSKEVVWENFKLAIERATP